MLKRKWLASAFMMMLPWLSYADASLTLTGNVVASPCTVDTDTVNKTVDLGTLQRRDLQTAGRRGAAGLRPAAHQLSGRNDQSDGYS